MKLENQIAVIAGGAGGIGSGITKAVALEGAHVIVWDINKEAMATLTKEVESFGGKITTDTVNIFDYNTVVEAVNQVVEKYGRIDIMVSTIGGGTFMPFSQITPELWQKELDYNLTTVFNCFHASINHMLNQKYGRLLCFISETFGPNAANLSGYAASKAGCKSLVEAISYEYMTQGVIANAIMPGYVLTPFTSKAFDGENGEATKQYVMSQLPLGPNTPEAVGKTAVDLLSSDRIIGQCIHMF